MTEWHGLATALATQLSDEGVLTQPGWRTAFEETPRHLFVPEYPLPAAYENNALVVQRRAAEIVGGATLELPTASASQPSVVAAMLERLNVQPGMSVLEIGTGTGYNAALLCHRLGDANVFSVDIDPGLVDRAGEVLRGLGYQPTLAAGDGYQGMAGGGPFDRIIATCSVNHVPPPWIQQLKQGGRIVAPLDGDECALMLLDRTAPDEVTGRFDQYPAGFMPLRTELSSPLPPGHQLGYRGPRMAHYGTSSLDPSVIAQADRDLLLFLHLHIAGLRIGTPERDNGPVVVVSSPTSHADVPLAPLDIGTWSTVQRGPRRLWDTVEHAMQRWEELQRPSRARLGISALDHADRQYVWLDDPNGRYSWPLPL